MSARAMKGSNGSNVEAEVIIKFQKILYWARLFNEDGRGQIVLTCRCILESTGNENAFRQPFVNAVLSSVGEFADRGLELVEAFDQIDLAGILEQMRALEFFPLSEVTSVLGQIIRNKLRRILLPAAARAGKGAEQERAARGGQAGDRCGEQTDRVARLYGERPEIFGSASWRTSVELASSVTSDEERRKFETRISAGERVNGAALIRARLGEQSGL
jgi:hypothetical protein